MILLDKGYMQKLSKIRLHYGYQTEMLKAREEELEYVEELTDAIDSLPADRDALLQEMADVYITMEHVKKIVNIPDREINEMIKYKIDRQMDRIHKEKGLTPCDN